jgi:ATP-dependent Clp protease ATP-binding subunit ClpB
VILQLGQIRKLLEANCINLEVSPAASGKLSKMGFDPQFGARPLKRVIQREVLNELSKLILAGKVHAGSRILLDAQEDRFVFRT